MGGIDMLLEEFNNKDMPGFASKEFKDLAIILKDLPLPNNLQLVDKLLTIRRIYARLNPPN